MLQSTFLKIFFEYHFLWLIVNPYKWNSHILYSIKTLELFFPRGAVCYAAPDVILTFEILSSAIQVKATEQYFPVILFVIPCKVI